MNQGTIVVWRRRALVHMRVLEPNMSARQGATPWNTPIAWPCLVSTYVLLCICGRPVQLVWVSKCVEP